MYLIYPIVSKYVIQRLIPFATTWFCESGFSAMMVLETKRQNQMDVEHAIETYHL